MKKLIVLFLFTSLFLAACGGNEESQSKENADTNSKESTETKKESEYPFPDSSAVGDAKITLSTPSGDSSNGNVPVLIVGPDDILIQIGADFENFQRDKQTFVYIDEIYSYSDQYGELTQTSLDLSEDSLKTGEHTVTAVQFENDDPNGKVVNLVEAKYEVKEGN